MKMYRLPNGNLLIPVNIEFDGIDGHLHIEITPDDPRYAEWEPFLGTPWEGVLSEAALERWTAKQEQVKAR